MNSLNFFDESFYFETHDVNYNQDNDVHVEL